MDPRLTNPNLTPSSLQKFAIKCSDPAAAPGARREMSVVRTSRGWGQAKPQLKTACRGARAPRGPYPDLAERTFEFPALAAAQNIATPALTAVRVVMDAGFVPSSVRSDFTTFHECVGLNCIKHSWDLERQQHQHKITNEQQKQSVGHGTTNEMIRTYTFGHVKFAPSDCP